MANRARQAAETPHRIAAAAAWLFLRHGYAATSINAIAAEEVQTIRYSGSSLT